MSAKTYATVLGFIQQFKDQPAVNAKEVSGVGTVYEFLVRAVGFTGQPLVKVTLWPEFAHVVPQLTAGTFVAADGAYTQNTVGERTYHNLSASTGLAILAGEVKAAGESRTVVNPVGAGVEAPF